MWDFLVHLPRAAKLAIMATVDAAVLPLLLWLSCILAMGYEGGVVVPWWMYLLAPAVSLPVFWQAGLYRAVTRYIGLDAMILVARSVTLSVLLLVVAAFVTRYADVAPAIFAIYWGAAILSIGGLRLTVRGLIARSASPRSLLADRVIVYGAGDAGRQLMSAIERSARYEPVCFVDDSSTMIDRDVGGYSVRSPKRLKDIVTEYNVGYVLVAIPTLTRERRLEIIASLERLPVRVMMMPGVSELVSGESVLTSLRDVDVEDLLNRDPVAPDEALLERTIRSKVVMVTGAGGSIGSELAKQVLKREPRRVVLVELSEYALYAVERELDALRATLPRHVEIVPMLGNVLDRDRMRAAFSEYGVQTVFHAAAYKHVPLVEANPLEGARNNVLGTYRTLKAALDAKVERFVLVSTDKAVRPTNVMGATKRLSELVVQAHADNDAGTKLAMVRFGNVLASSGSVVPLFREQIRRGGPITVTHADVNRYFMTIPEATQLVMQAGAMGDRGDVFVLDMGEPVKIIDLARRMIHLSGYSVKSAENPHGEVEIKITGLRPGEKLYEELLIGEDDRPTDHQRIRMASEESLPLDVLERHVAALAAAYEAQDVGSVRGILEATVSGYSPSRSFKGMSGAPESLDHHPKVTTLPRAIPADQLSQ